MGDGDRHGCHARMLQHLACQLGGKNVTMVMFGVRTVMFGSRWSTRGSVAAGTSCHRVVGTGRTRRDGRFGSADGGAALAHTGGKTETAHLCPRHDDSVSDEGEFGVDLVAAGEMAGPVLRQ